MDTGSRGNPSTGHIVHFPATAQVESADPQTVINGGDAVDLAHPVGDWTDANLRNFTGYDAIEVWNWAISTYAPENANADPPPPPPPPPPSAADHL